MAIIKSFTSLEQSKKLAEILPSDSADMEYLAIKENGQLVGSVPFAKDDSEVEDSAYSHTYDRIACWSLAALLGILPNYQLQTQDDGIGVLCSCKGKFNIVTADTPIDACYEMILKLNELNLL